MVPRPGSSAGLPMVKVPAGIYILVSLIIRHGPLGIPSLRFYHKRAPNITRLSQLQGFRGVLGNDFDPVFREARIRADSRYN